MRHTPGSKCGLGPSGGFERFAAAADTGCALHCSSHMSHRLRV